MKPSWIVVPLLWATMGLAQEPIGDVDDLEPAVNTSAGELAPPADLPPIDAPEAGRAAPEAGGTKVAGGYRTMDELDLGTTSITGNQELPKVLYIIPWKNSDLGDLVGRPVNTLLDEVLAPVDPEVFRRHLDYYDNLYGESQEE
jgi:hypothetical protein